MESNWFFPLQYPNSFAFLIPIFQVKLSSGYWWPAHIDRMHSSTFLFPRLPGALIEPEMHTPIALPLLLSWLFSFHYSMLLVKFCVFWYSNRPKDDSLIFQSVVGQYDLIFPSCYIPPLGLASRNNSVAFWSKYTSELLNLSMLQSFLGQIGLSATPFYIS